MISQPLYSDTTIVSIEMLPPLFTNGVYFELSFGRTIFKGRQQRYATDHALLSYWPQGENNLKVQLNISFPLFGDSYEQYQYGRPVDWDFAGEGVVSITGWLSKSQESKIAVKDSLGNIRYGELHSSGLLKMESIRVDAFPDG